MTALLDCARKDGYASISLSAEEGQSGLYERQGFSPVEAKDGTVTMKADL